MDVEAYIESLSVSDSEKSRTRSDLTAFLKILTSHGRTFPEECDYQEYRAMKSTDKNTRTTESRIRRIKRYFEAQQKGEAQMSIPEEIIPSAVTEEIVQAEQPEAQSNETLKGTATETSPEALLTLETEEKKSPRMGAPRKSSELRDKKITIYITASLEEDVKDLARIDGRTTPDYIFRLIERESEKRANDLASIREMRQRNA